MTLVADNLRATIGGNNPPSIRGILEENYRALADEVAAMAGRAEAAPREVKSDADLGAIADVVRDARKLSKRTDEARVREKEPHLSAGRDVDVYFKLLAERLDRIVRALEDRATAWQRAKAADARRAAEQRARTELEEANRQREIAARAAEKNRPTVTARHTDRAEAAEDRAAEAAAAAAASNADLTRIRSDGGVVASARTVLAFEILDLAAIPLDVLRPYIARDDIEKALRTFVRVTKGATPIAGVRIFEDVRANFR